ncbi:MAG TPA: FkbM family methyltransferase [Bacteroidales bacterium]
MRSTIKKIIPENILRSLKNTFLKPYEPLYRRSYSQNGEDMILDFIFRDVNKGFYVDVGANNPKIQSNTQFFYEVGWNGINIDALPGSMKSFNRQRPRDINLEIPVFDSEKTLTFYVFQDSMYNTFSEEKAETVPNKLVEKKELQTKTLSWILEKYLKNKEIDFLTIDVESVDFHVLKSNDWNKFRPKTVLFELLEHEIKSKEGQKMFDFMLEKGYHFYCNTPKNVFFIENSFYKTRFLK